MRRYRHCNLCTYGSAHAGYLTGESARQRAGGRPRQGGLSLKYTIPTSDLVKLGLMNANSIRVAIGEAVMKDDSPFSVEAAP
jgi:hypothetical protein